MFTVTFCFRVNNILSTSLCHVQLLEKYNVSFRQSEHAPFTQTCSSGTFSKAMTKNLYKYSMSKFQRCLLQRNILNAFLICLKYGKGVPIWKKMFIYIIHIYRLEYFFNCSPGYMCV